MSSIDRDLIIIYNPPLGLSPSMLDLDLVSTGVVLLASFVGLLLDRFFLAIGEDGSDTGIGEELGNVSVDVEERSLFASSFCLLSPSW